MSAELSSRYAPGGDIYATIAAQHGAAGADRVWRAYQSGEAGAVAAVLSELDYGAPLSESTAALFAGQIVTDPLGAPLDSANRALGIVFLNTLKSFIRNPWVLLVLAGVGAFLLWRAWRK